MLIIPVVDLMGGVVVRATAGRRDAYRPIISPLAASSAPCDIVAGFLRLHPFTVVYVADLDAILGRGDNISAARSLADKFPRNRLLARLRRAERRARISVRNHHRQRDDAPRGVAARSFRRARRHSFAGFSERELFGASGPGRLAASVACPSHRHDAGARRPGRWAGLRDIGRDQGAAPAGAKFSRRAACAGRRISRRWREAASPARS